MLDKLPEFIDPINSVNHNKQFVGRVNQSRLTRLVELIGASDRDIKVELNFFYDKALKFPAFTMKLETVLELQCQRSLETFEYLIESETKGIFTESLALAKDLPTEIEVFLLTEEDKMSSFDWVEEELLLSVPLAPINDSSSIHYKNETVSDVDGYDASEKSNPFAILQTLKK
ncbi:MAG: YceD family protein [Thiomicrorhabdus sp.]|nr:YceD family protein [Thiomicrorhabdus sp.]